MQKYDGFCKTRFPRNKEFQEISILGMGGVGARCIELGLGYGGGGGKMIATGFGVLGGWG